MPEETLRPQYKIEEIATPTTPVQVQEQVQVQTNSPVSFPQSNHPHREHKLKKFLFLVPALLIILAIAIAAYFMRNDFVQRPPEIINENQTETLASPTPIPSEAPKNPLVFYSNTNFKFSYPSELKLYECEGTIYFFLGEEVSDFCSSLVGGVIKISSSGSAYNKNAIDILSEEEILVSGFTTSRVEFRASEGSNIFVELPFKDNFYLFELLDPQHENEFNKILGTFELIYDKTEGWQEYENSQAGYSLKYPPNWILKADLNDEGEIISPNFTLSKSENTTLQTLDVKFTIGATNAARTASEIISSSRSLSGWDEAPISEFREIGGANATVIKGSFKGVWNTFVVVWYRSTVVEMIWQDSLEKEFEETVELILASFSFR